MSVPDRIKELIETFENNLESYKKGNYNETQVRREFIDPFFEELGWDVTNRQGYAEAYKDVIHEDAIKVGGVTKAPDYCFRVGGTRKFFLEAKKPSVNIQRDIHPAYQLRRYGWSAKLPLSILTDFEELAVYDCRVKPSKTDKVSHSRILYLKYTDYENRWKELAGIFSRDAILKGSFDKYVESNKKKKGTTEVDTAFLHEIESWRELLARNIALRNPNLSQRELNFAVQQTIDRIVFLRICEDRGMENYGGLMALRNGENVYKRLFHLFNKADEKYNSGLFHFKKEKGRENCDNLTPLLQIDDKPLKEIFKNLYYPESPYEFSVLSADILGQVYERFLGKVIRLTPGHQAKIEEKPEVRKAGGVYYTPAYIVDYIVKNTLGKLVEGKRPGPRGGVSNLKILDPACGSGSFLIGAYQFLLDWHRDEYINDGPEKWSKGKTPRVYQSRNGEWRLTTDERKRILLNNIYGVDIDHQAVEVTKLSLLLKVLEGEDEQSIGKQMLLFQERVLPDLSNNIKCGNSLIGPDFYDNQQMSVFNEEEIYRVNAFDWNAEFSEVMKGGGFDAVIGNPPYLKETNNKHTFDLIRQSRTNRYCMGKMDLWYAFACVAIDLTRKGGFHSFIATNNWITNHGAELLREKIMSETMMFQFVDFGDFRVFPQASIQTMIYIIKKEPILKNYKISFSKFEKDNSEKQIIKMLSQSGDKNFGWRISTINPNKKGAPFNLIDLSIASFLNRIDSFATSKFGGDEVGNGIDVLQDFVTKKHLQKLSGSDVQIGDGIFVLNEKEKKKISLTQDDCAKIKPYFTTQELGRYVCVSKNKLWLIYADKHVRENISCYLGIKEHLDKFKNILTSAFKPYGLHRPRNENFFIGEKILSVRKTRYPQFSLTTFPCYVSRAFLVIKPEKRSESNKYLLGILNSRLISFWLYHCGKKQGNQLQIDKQPICDIPIRTINFEDPNDIFRHDRIVGLVDQIIGLNQNLIESKTPQTKEMLKRQIESTDSQIDQLVYKLYELTDDEIKIVESEI
jgi:adenine-specific DNA-methyltransferase